MVRGIFKRRFTNNKNEKASMSGAGPEPAPPAVNFGDTPGDVQMTSSDGIAFSLHRENLRAHSQTFRHLLDAAGPTAAAADDDDDARPAPVTLDERADVLEAVFKFCYPSLGTSDFASTDTFLLIDCGRAAHKYQIGVLLVIVSQHLELRFSHESEGVEATARAFGFAHLVEDLALMKLCADGLVRDGFGPFEQDAAFRYRLTNQAWEQLRTFLIARRAAIVERIVSASFLLVQHVEDRMACRGREAWGMMAFALLGHLSTSPSQPMFGVPEPVREALLSSRCPECHYAWAYFHARLTRDPPGVPDDVNRPTWHAD